MNIYRLLTILYTASLVMVNCFDKPLFARKLTLLTPDRLGCVQIPLFRGIDSTFHQNACAVFFFLFFHSISATMTKNGVQVMQADKTTTTTWVLNATFYLRKVVHLINILKNGKHTLTDYLSEIPPQTELSLFFSIKMC